MITSDFVALRFGILILILSVNFTTNGTAQTVKSAFESEWNGFSRVKTDLSGNGEVILKQKFFDVIFNVANDTFTGKTKTTMNISGRNYSVTYEIRGTFDYSTYKVVMNPWKKLSSDTLPNGLEWSADKVTLTVFSDTNHPGHYIMQGKTESMTHPEEGIELATSPKYWKR